MKILHTVEFYHPSVGGAQEVVKQLSERMVVAGHDVTVATAKLPDRQKKIINGVKIVEFEISGNSVLGIKGEKDKYQKYLLESKYDVIMNYASQIWTSDLFFEVMDDIKARKVFVPCGFSGLYNENYHDYYQKMPGLLAKYDATVYLSNDYRDVNFAREHGINNIHVIPNGASEMEFGTQLKTNIRHELGIDKDSFLILSIGSHTGLKGHRESMEIFQKVRLKNTTLLIGANHVASGCEKTCLWQAKKINRSLRSRLDKKRVIIRNLDRKRVVAAYQSANLFLFVSNIETSPIVLFEACASATPFFVADVGNSKEIIDWTGGGVLAPTSKDKLGYSHVNIANSAKLLTELALDKMMLKKLGEQGHKSWQSKYTWEKIAEQYMRLYERN